MEQTGLGTEVQELGVVGLIGLLLLPGALWIARGGNGVAKTRRTAVVAAIVVGALALEAALDRSAETLVQTVEGEAA